jgi:hypothetical protein
MNFFKQVGNLGDKLGNLLMDSDSEGESEDEAATERGAEVGLYKLHAGDPWPESAWFRFQPLNLYVISWFPQAFTFDATLYHCSEERSKEAKRGKKTTEAGEGGEAEESGNDESESESEDDEPLIPDAVWGALAVARSKITEVGGCTTRRPLGCFAKKSNNSGRPVALESAWFQPLDLTRCSAAGCI